MSRKRGGGLAAVFPELGSRVALPPKPPADPESERFLLFGAIANLLTRATALGTVVVVLDDLQWADRPSLQLLRQLVSLPVEGPVMLVGSVRDTDVGIDHPMADLSAALHRETGVDRIMLRGLDDAELLEFLERSVGYELEGAELALRDTLLAETDGNPFYTREMLRHLVGTGALRQGESGRWESADGVRILELPVSVREVVGRRVAGLGDAASSALSAAAVLGRDFDIDILEQVVSDIDAESLAGLLDGAISASVLEEIPTSPGRLTFAHALFQRTLYNDLTSVRRRRLHERALDVLESMPGRASPAELARHAIEALTPSTSSAALTHALAAGDQALEGVAAAAAADWYRRALELVPPDDDVTRADVLLRLGHALRASGDAAYGETFIEAGRLADKIGDRERLTDAALASTRGYAADVTHVDMERIGMIERALALCGTDDLATKARLLSRLAEEVSNSRDYDAVALSYTALDAAEASGDDQALAAALQVVLLQGVADNLGQRLECIERFWDAAYAAATPFQRFWLHYNRAVALVETGTPLAIVQEEVRAACRVNDDVSIPLIDIVAGGAMKWMALATGDLVAAERLLELFGQAAIERAGYPDAAVFDWIHRDWLETMKDGVSPLDPAVEALFLAIEDLPAFRVFIAAGWAHYGRVDEAAELVRPFVQAGLHTFGPRVGRTLALVGMSEVTLLTRDRNAARQLVTILNPVRDQIAVAGLVAVPAPVALALARARVVLGESAAADSDYAHATGLVEAAGIESAVPFIQFERAKALLDWEHGDRELARRLLESSLESATHHGFGGVERDARELLAAL